LRQTLIATTPLLALLSGLGCREVKSPDADGQNCAFHDATEARRKMKKSVREGL
jgi:hypothetical protein